MRILPAFEEHPISKTLFLLEKNTELKMELPDLGKQCEVPSCKELDFLPIQCKFCDKIFCKKCASLVAHNCPSQSLNTLEDLPPKNVSKIAQENVKEVSKCSFCNIKDVAVTCPR